MAVQNDVKNLDFGALKDGSILSTGLAKDAAIAYGFGSVCTRIATDFPFSQLSEKTLEVYFSSLSNTFACTSVGFNLGMIAGAALSLNANHRNLEEAKNGGAPSAKVYNVVRITNIAAILTGAIVNQYVSNQSYIGSIATSVLVGYGIPVIAQNVFDFITSTAGVTREIPVNTPEETAETKAETTSEAPIVA